MIAIVVLLCLLTVAAITDVMRQSIFNWNTYPGILCGLILNYLGYGISGAGRAAFQQGLIGLFACGFVMLFCFVMFQMGGGDVKLIAMVGSFLGLECGIEAMLWTFILGGIAAVGMLIWQTGLLRLISKITAHLKLILRTRTWVPLIPEERQQLNRGLFLAPCSFVAVCIVAKSQLFQ